VPEPYIRRMRDLALVLALAVGAAGSLAAQSEGGRFQPIAAWTTPYVEHLIRAGVIRDPDPLSRPLRRSALARALREVDTTAAGEAVRGMVRLLSREFEAPETDSVRWSVEATLGALAASDARRWAERPAADSAGLFPIGGLEGALEMSHLTLVTHPVLDGRLKFDPDYWGKKDRAIAGRTSQAYALGSWRYADFFLGTEDRNLGPTDVTGLAVSPSPYAFEHLFVRLGPPRLRLELLATQLDALAPWDSVATAVRYFSLHRLVGAPTDRLTFSVFETAVYTRVDGVSRSWEPWALSVVNPFYVSQYTGPEMNANLGLGADASYRVGRGNRVFGQVFIDDLQIDRADSLDKEPPGYALTVGASGGLARGSLSWTAFYTMVTNLTYRTARREERYTRYGVGLGRDYSDYDQATLRVSAVAVPRALVTGELTVIRQGEGDIRDRFPPVSAYADSLTFLTGVVERTVRLAAQATWTPRPDVTLSVDLGRHFVSNAGHVDGASEGRWVWRVRGELRRRYGGTIR